MKRLIAIGDIHGCYNELVALINQIDPTQDDTLIFLGDYIDRGPNSAGVISLLMGYQKKYSHWKFLLGNHEDLMLDAIGEQKLYGDYYLWWNQGGKETCKSYQPLISDYELILVKDDIISREHKDWIKVLDMYYETDEYFFVHAGVKPGIEPSKTSREDMLWIRDEFIDSNYDWGKKIIFGHTPNQRTIGVPIVMGNKIGIDGAICAPGNENLIAVDLTNNRFYLQPAL